MSHCPTTRRHSLGAVVSKLRPAIAACLISLTPTLSHADTIYLRSGMYIVVTRTEQKDGQIKYWVGEDQYEVSKGDVLKIEPGNGPAPSAHSAVAIPTNLALPAIQDLTRREPAPGAAGPQHDKLKLPLPMGPKQNEAYWNGLRTRITVGDTIDDIRLAEIELQHDKHTTADAYYIAGITEIQRGNAEKASGYFAHAIQAMHNQVNLLEWHATALAMQGKYPDAVYELERANTLQPNSAELLRALGLARYDADRTADAIAAWKRSLELAPDAYTERLLHKAEREAEVEERSKSKESRHFTLHYQGEKTPPDLQRELLATLENEYQDLSRQLSYAPVENIIVILYTDKEFQDITEAPSWAGALNDGKLRIPIGGITTMNSELSRVLEHELTHSFVKSMAGGRCPTWLNEGLAQMMEPRSSTSFAGQLAPLFLQRKAIPFSVLEHSFTRFSNLQAEVAYAESLSATEYLRGRYGMDEILRMLQSIGSGVEPEEALKHSTGMDYSVLQERVGDYLEHLR